MLEVETQLAKGQYEVFLGRIIGFLREVIGAEQLLDREDYIPGSERINLYPGVDSDGPAIVIEADTSGRSPRVNYESELVQRLHTRPNFNLLILVGGLGAGKSTTVNYVSRQLAELAGSSNCPCGRIACPRRPLIIDFLKTGNVRKKKGAVRRAMKEIRFALYTRLLEEWLAPTELTPQQVLFLDDEYTVLRRLLIVNDIVGWKEPLHPNHVGLVTRSLTMGGTLLELEPTLDVVKKLIDTYREAAPDLDDLIQDLTEDSEKSRDFMRLLLEFYVQRCSTENPLNILIIDNLDQLPTAHIEAILDELLDAASEIPKISILVPLRPSSIANRSYKRQLIFRYHHGPNNFTMVLHRLIKYVLGRSVEDLKSGQSYPSPWQAGEEPTDEEVKAFVVCSYFYALILVVGEDKGGDPVVKLKERVHADHHYLFLLQIPSQALRELAGTLDALVGRCCRYALNQLQRFFQNFYIRPIILSSAVGRTDLKGISRSVPVPYGQLVYTLLAESRHPIAIPRVSNLFLPARARSHPNYPTLSKLRILALLNAKPRMVVSEVASRLARTGIPLEAVLDNLNSLHNKFRLLLWFSTNSSLRAKKRDLRQDVVLSEHGHEYFRRVLGNFEYVWYCAIELAERPVNDRSLTFQTKLEEYLRLLDLLGETEWKQIGFYRSSLNAIPDISRQLNQTEMITLRILYETLATAFNSTEIVLGLKKVSPEYKTYLNLLVSQLVTKVELWERRYRMAYGGTGYLVLYAPAITRATTAMTALHFSESLAPEIKEQIESIISAWSEDARQDDLRPQLSGELPKEDIVSLVSKLGGGIPGLKGFVQNLDKQQITAAYIKRFIHTKASLKALLRRRLPTYSEVDTMLRVLVTSVEYVVGAARKHASSGTSTLEWFLEEEQFLKAALRNLEMNSFNIPELCMEAEMDRYKKRFNNVMSLFRDLAIHLGVEDLQHLEVMWHA